MKLTQFVRGGEVRLGLVTERGLLDVTAAGEAAGTAAPGTMLEAIRGGEAARRVLESLSGAPGPFVSEPTFAPAVTGGEKILCVGLNYRAHIEETDEITPEYPLLFSKFSNALAAHGESVALDPEWESYDYEAELVIVIGRRARNVSAEEARSCVFGYTCGNDLSNRETQLHRGGQWLIGKSMDSFGPVGPAVVTADAFDPADKAIRSRVNGELRQDSRTSLMIFSCEEIVSYASRHMTLQPGDLIFTGTPAGVELGRKEKSWLKPGDRVEIEIEGIGSLENRMVREATQ